MSALHYPYNVVNAIMKYFSLFLVTLALVGAGCGSNQSTGTAAGTSLAGSADANTNDTPQEGTTQGVTIAPSADTEGSDDGVTNGAYIDYDASAVTQAAENGTAVLFFHASWCPTCKALNDDIEASLSDIPDGVTIFKTDYDTNVDLKQQYGVTYQHTLVQVDADGNTINKWSGGNTLETVLDNIQ